MHNDNLLIASSGSYKGKIKIKNKMIEYNMNGTIFNGDIIKDILSFVKEVERRYSKTKLPIHFNLGHIKIQDKLTYVLFEIICNYLIEKSKRKVIVSFSANNLKIGTCPKNNSDNEDYSLTIQNEPAFLC